MIHLYTLRHKIDIILMVILCLTIHICAADDIKRERPGDLFSPLKIPLLEDPERDTWQKPERILEALKIEKGQSVGDLGAGSGYLTVKISERVGTPGIVYAVDVQKEMLDYIKDRIHEKGIKNVTLVLSTMDDPGLPPESLDTAILLSVYHEITKPVDFIKKVRKALKPNGKLAILEFADTSPIGPPIHRRLPEDVVIHEVTQSGFALLERHAFLLPYQYFLVFTLSH